MGWYGFDLDGTLARDDREWDGGIGEPIPPMIENVKFLLSHGIDVRIFTARVSKADGVGASSGLEATDEFIAEQERVIQEWCLKHIGKVLPVTCIKDFHMVCLFDDRAYRVIRNTGEIVY